MKEKKVNAQLTWANVAVMLCLALVASIALPAPWGVALALIFLFPLLAPLLLVGFVLVVVFAAALLSIGE